MGGARRRDSRGVLGWPLGPAAAEPGQAVAEPQAGWARGAATWQGARMTRHSPLPQAAPPQLEAWELGREPAQKRRLGVGSDVGGINQASVFPTLFVASFSLVS